MKNVKRFLSVVLCLIMIIGTLSTGVEGFGSIFTVKANGAYNRTLKENADGSFRILQLSDIQDNSYLSAKAFATIRLAIRKYNPNLIVLTGDNILHCNGDDVFRTTVDSFVNEFKDASGNTIPFAVTFGNHDYEVNYHDEEQTQRISLKDQYEYYLSKGAVSLKQDGLNMSGVSSASDNSATKWGTGYIDVYTNDGLKVARRVILLNTGSYDNDITNRNKFARVGYNVETGEEESYSNVVSAVNSWTNAVNGAGEKIKCAVYQHIALQEVYLGDSPETSILTKPTVSGSITHACYNNINNSTITVNPEGSGRRQYVVSTTNPTLTGTFDEAPKCSYNSTKDLFIALAKNNVIGVFYGHDHGNTVSAETKITYNGTQYTLTQGFGGGIDVYDGNYNGVDPQGSCYVIDKDGNLIKEAFSYTGLLTDDITYPSGDANIKYIKEVALFNGSSFENACEEARNAGYIPVTKAFAERSCYADLNSNNCCSSKFVGNGSNYECIAYKQTTNPNEAITDLRIFVTTDGTYSRNNQTKTYTLNGKESEYRIVSGCDGNVNYGVTSDTTRAFLYYSKNINAGAPLTDLVVEVGTGSSTDAYRTMDHRALQIGNFVETFGTNDVSSFSNVRIANFNLGVTRDTVIGDSIYLFLKRYDGCSGYNTDVPEGIVSEASDPYDDDTKTLIENNGGYIYGVCQPSNNYDALSDIGFNWVRFDIPCPFSEAGYNNGDIKYVKSSYEEYKEKCRQYKAKGFKILAVTPYPYDFYNDMNFNPMEDLNKLKDISVYLYNDLKDLVDMFQITNEMNIDVFRRVSTDIPLTFEQAATYIGVQLEAISAEKAKTGDTFPIGYNCGDVTDRSMEFNGFLAPYYQYCDYVATDIYTGSQEEATEKIYSQKIKQLNSVTGKPIIITEFGFWSEGGPKTAEQKAAILYDNYGYSSEAAAIADGQNFINKLPSQFRKTLQQEHPNEQSQWPSIVFHNYSNHFYGETSPYTINNIPHTPEGQGEYFRQVMTELKNVSCLAGMIIYCCTDHDVCFNCGHSWCPFETKYGIFNYDGTPKASVPAIKETIATLKAIDRLVETTDSVSEKTSITVYHKNGSKALSCDMGEIYEGSTVTVSPKPIAGYTCTESSTQYTNVSSAVSATYNTYTPVTYTATKNVDGANTTVSFNIDGTALVLNTPQKDGYNFIGWKAVTVAGNSLNKTNFIKNKIYAAGTYTGMYGNVTFEAQWEKLPYTVTFDISNGGTNLSMASKSVHFGEAYGELATVTAPNGLYFAGWNTKKDGSGSVITSKTICDLTANQTLYACYSNTVYHVAYDNLFIPEEWVNKGGNNLINGTSPAVYNSDNNSISLTNENSEEVYTKTNYDTMTISVTPGTTYSISVEGTETGGSWANLRVFVFDDKGTVLNLFDIVTIDAGTTQIKTGTYTAPAGATKATLRFDNRTKGTTITVKNTTFVEKTAADRLDRFISYPSRYDTAVKGAAYDSLTVPTRPGYTFDGWYSDAGLTNKIDENDVVTCNITLYSKWIDINEVTYDNLFSISEYAASNSPKLNVIEGIAPIDLNKGSITVPGGPSGHTPYTKSETDSGYYTIPVTAGTKYYLSFYIDNWGGQFFVFFDKGTSTDTNMALHSGTNYIGGPLNGDNAQKYTFYFRVPSGATKITLRFDASGSAPRTYSDIKVIDEAHYYSDGLYDSAFSYVNANSTYGQLQTPTRSGYSFDGWYTASGTRVTSTSSTGSSNVKLFSHWTKAFDINYNSIFDFDRWGENQVKSGATYNTEVNYGTNSYTITTTSAHTGEVTSTANGGNAYRMPVVGGHKYKISADITADKTNPDSKLYNLLVFEWPEIYDVWSGYLTPLNERNSTLSPGATQTCSLEFTTKENAKTISLRLALKTDGAGKGTFSNIRIQDMTVTPYPEAFVQMNVLKTDSLMNQPDKEGYDKNGWYDTVNADGIGGTQYTSPSSFTGNKSLYAKYTQKTFNVTYKSANETLQVKTLAYGENPSAYTPTSTPTGYKFGGWYADEALRTFAPLTVTEPLTLYANWEPLTYNVGYDNIFLLKSQNIANSNVSTVDKNNGTVTMTYQNSTDSSEKNLTTDFIELPSAAGSDTYYIVSADVSATDCKARIMTFFYDENGNQCSIWHTNDASHPIKERDGTVNNGETPIYAAGTDAHHYYIVKVPEGCRKIKLRFDCLNVDTSKRRIAVFSNIRVVEKTVNTYLTAAANYSTVADTVDFNCAYNLPAITTPGYSLEGWYTDSACTVPANTTVCNTVGNHILYSKWTADRLHVSYDEMFDLNAFDASDNIGNISDGILTVDDGETTNNTSYKIPVNGGTQYALSYNQYHLTTTINESCPMVYMTFYNGNTALTPDKWKFSSYYSSEDSRYDPSNRLDVEPFNETIYIGYVGNENYFYTREKWVVNGWRYGYVNSTEELGKYAPAWVKFIVPDNATSVVINFGADPSTGGAKFKNISLSRCANTSLADSTYTLCDTNLKGSRFNITPTTNAYDYPEKQGFTFLGWTIGDTNEWFADNTDLSKYPDGIRLKSHWVKTEISLGGGMDEQDILESPLITILSVNGTPISGVGMTKVTGQDIDLNINGNGVVSYTLKNMTWSKPEAFTLSLSKGGTAEITIYPQTTILYEESSGTFSASYDEGTTPWGWRVIEDDNSELRIPGTSDSKIYGYSNAYANNNQYSAGHAKRTTVSNNDSDYPTYTFTFKGTGFDIIGMCDDNSGLMAVEIMNGEEPVDTVLVNTHHSGGKRYQEVVYHKDNLDYGTYTVTVTVCYSYLFDLTDNTQTAGYNTVIPESGSIVDLSAMLGKEYSHCKYYCVESETYRAGNTDIVDFEPVVVGKGIPYTEIEGSYDVTIDGVRIYNPGDIDNYNDLADKYEADGENNATYEKLVDIFNRIKVSDPADNSLYIEGGKTGSWTKYQQVGSKSEVQIFAGLGQAVAFSVSNYEKLHISFKAVGGLPQGKTLTAIVNGHEIDINSATEQYYDVTDFIDKDGNIAITCDADYDGAILAICSFKSIAKPSSTQSAENTVIFEATESALLNARTMLAALQAPEAEDMIFAVNFGKYGTTYVKVKKAHISVKKVNGVWTATAKLSQNTLEELMESMGITDDYGIEGKSVTLTATRVGDQWQTQQTTVKVKKLNLFEKLVQKIVRFFTLVIERITLKFKSSRDI